MTTEPRPLILRTKPWRTDGNPWLDALVAAEEAVPGQPSGILDSTFEGLLSVHALPDADPPGSRWIHDVAYGTAGAQGRDLTLSGYVRSDASERAPAVIFVHGGGWGGGDRAFHYRHVAELAARGQVGLTISYRLAQEAPWPACVEDAKCAVRWVRAHAVELGVDPDRVAIAGGSAGGHLSAMVALTPGRWEGDGGWVDESSAVQGAFLWQPATDLEALPLREAVDHLVKGEVEVEATTQERLSASPVTYVHAGGPPIWTYTGSADAITPADQISDFHAALDAAGVPNRLFLIDGKDHGFDLLPADFMASLDTLFEFVDQHLR